MAKLADQISLNQRKNTWPLGKDRTILKYVQHLHGLSSPTGPLAEDLNPTAIREANQQAQAVLRDGGQLKKRGKIYRV